METGLRLHLLSLGIWFGCILTEVAFERLVDGSAGQRRLIARIHVVVDTYVEIPAFLLALATGVAMLSTAPTSWLFMVKLAAGLGAILFNVLCVRMVFRRRRLADANRFDEYVSVDHRQHVYGTVVLVAFLVALIVGMFLP